jgi:hypothetical protein
MKKKTGNTEKPCIYMILAKIKGRYYLLVLLRSHWFTNVSPTLNRRSININKILAIKSFNELS